MYDLAIIGAGWAGYNAALRAKNLNLKVALIEKSFTGGTCLNLGCIPTKTLIQSARVFNLIKKSSNFGINSSSPDFNLNKVQERKNRIVDDLRSGMQFMLKGVDLFNCEARLISPFEINVAGKTIEARNILIATGSSPLELSQIKFDGKKILSSDEALSLKDLPVSLLIIGGGAIGCEFANLFSILGTKVTIIERMPSLLPGEDSEVAKKIEGIFNKRGIIVNTNTDASSVSFDDFSLVLVSVGRFAKCAIPGLEEINVKLDNGKVIVDEYLKTNLNNIYAAGDCTGKIMLAHYAAYQGRLAVDNIFGKGSPNRLNYSGIPNCIFTDPEIASVGLNEEGAMKRGISINKYKFDFLGSGMARIIDETQGFLKIIADRENETILGCSIIGPKATEIIGIMALALSCRLTVRQLRNTIFAHPTISESISEALRYKE
jgi:dihydrolipoamide dehydrogenase